MFYVNYLPSQILRHPSFAFLMILLQYFRSEHDNKFMLNNRYGRNKKKCHKQQKYSIPMRVVKVKKKVFSLVINTEFKKTNLQSSSSSSSSSNV